MSRLAFTKSTGHSLSQSINIQTIEFWLLFILFHVSDLYMWKKNWLNYLFTKDKHLLMQAKMLVHISYLSISFQYFSIFSISRKRRIYKFMPMSAKQFFFPLLFFFFCGWCKRRPMCQHHWIGYRVRYHVQCWMLKLGYCVELNNTHIFYVYTFIQKAWRYVYCVSQCVYYVPNNKCSITQYKHFHHRQTVKVYWLQSAYTQFTH